MKIDYEIGSLSNVVEYIGDDGNTHLDFTNKMFFLKDENNHIISKLYYYIIDLGNDHFAVCDIVNTIIQSDLSIGDDYEIKEPKLKWGIIRVNRDKKGKIIPRRESRVVKFLYDRISGNNLKSVTAYSGQKLTYINLDRTSLYYGQQLVPCLLDHAVPFNVTYKYFAECSIDGIVGYLPRNCKPRKNLNGYDLLTEEQVLNMTRFWENPDDYYPDHDTINAYLNLIGEKLDPEKPQQLKRFMLFPSNKM